MVVYALDVVTDPKAMTATLKLKDVHEIFLAGNEVKLADHEASLWEGLFDTRRHVRRYAEHSLPDGQTTPATAEQLLERLGVFLGEHVLGKGVTAKLADGMGHRTLLVRLPDPRSDVLAAAFARVPWEMARPGPGQPSLSA